MNIFFKVNGVRMISHKESEYELYLDEGDYERPFELFNLVNKQQRKDKIKFL